MRLLPPLHVVLAAIVTSVAAPAHAQWTRHHGGECIPQLPASLGTFAVTMAGATSADPGWGVDLVCASDDSDEYPDSAVTRVRIYLYDGSPTDKITLSVCTVVRDAPPPFVRCSGTTETTDSFVGATVFTLSGDDLDAWRQGYDFGYLYIWLPAKSGATGFSYVKGWITEQ
jgi:hypothetical protein